VTHEPTNAVPDLAGGVCHAREGVRARALIQASGWAAVIGAFAVGLSLLPEPNAAVPTTTADLGASAGQVRALAFGPGGVLCAAGADGRAWVRAVDPVAGRAAPGGADLPGDAVAFSGDGSAVVVGDGLTVSLRGVAAGELRAEFATRTGRPFAVASNGDGSVLAASDAHGVTVWLGGPAGRGRRTTLPRPDVLSLAFAPDGGLLATGDKEGYVRLWDLSTGLQRFAARAHARGVTSLAFSDDGRTLASASNHSDPAARLWDASSGRALAALRGHSAAVQGVAFAPGGRSVATAAMDGTVRVWDVAGGLERQTLKGDGLLALALAFSPDGRQLAAGGIGHEVWLWDLAAAPRAEGPEGGTESPQKTGIGPAGIGVGLTRLASERGFPRGEPRAATQPVPSTLSMRRTTSFNLSRSP
jgi:WD40 repeat protein